jgi:dihydropteroate synthase
LDPAGYFIIYLDRSDKSIVAEHYTNTINKNGVACDPDTGRPIPCTPGYVRQASAVYRGRTAKDISVALIEQANPPITRLEHANYLGREFQRAEFALLSGDTYVQD